ncbi:uncharacterized protein EKO05_0004896 [Ascochyta rabiei]|uniref:Uncharacterized protein n=1 Tax=Didymella rabiei TaxID=5454 RepID=A0A163LKN2_DIDRA|nr:uncharacterized protein EKO05_0004896 [Ascochyta rabiei]KZM27874.1 hypothetical protein ST47_g990 [Ascochyta rabiei]UPX14414.1 hypothetical protein EKO05_0004896 [Ascochyta rabiei]
MESSEGQLALIKVWANGTGFEIDTTKSPKANFAGLAKAQGWVGGDANWRLHWEACFKELYLFGHREASATPTTPATSAATLDLAGRSRRRLSSSSDNSAVSVDSNFSLISAAPSVQSLDTNGSIMGGVILGLESVTVENMRNVSCPATDTEPQHSKASAKLTHSVEGTTSASQSGTTDDAQPLPDGSPFWYQYPGFEPDPRASFKDELGRLCKHVGAKTKGEKKTLQAKALTAEIEYHYGASMSRLDRWQELCEEVGIEKIPTSITQCQKVLKPVFVNLFNLIDHRRNPDLKVLRFQSYGEFSKFTKKGHEFPRSCAKQEGFIRALLKKI